MQLECFIRWPQCLARWFHLEKNSCLCSVMWCGVVDSEFFSGMPVFVDESVPFSWSA